MSRRIIFPDKFEILHVKQSVRRETDCCLEPRIVRQPLGRHAMKSAVTDPDKGSVSHVGPV